ncbi:MAG: hypothetical protein HY036_10860 [Nitrospirae bacterium]|nr:hypothetical protein [Nitrospirota bacterium]MBI3353063.1 hypothetical protein [Nitrospirota bacterium]
MALERGPVSQTGNLYFGPYPTDDEFTKLKKIGIKRIVSLLDERIPYEHILLNREKELAEKFHMEFNNFPMASLFDQHLFSDYQFQAKEAVDTLLQYSTEMIYIHCYLGKHRTQFIRNELSTRKGLVIEPLLPLSDEDILKYKAAEKQIH